MEIDPVAFGENVRRMREVQRLTRRELSKRAGVHEDTLARVEAGLPSQGRVRQRVAIALGTSAVALERPTADEEEGIAVHRAPEGVWRSIRDRRPVRPGVDLPALDDAERVRLARLGLVTAFEMKLNCRLGQGELVAGIIEPVRLADPAPYHGGEEFVFCLRGRARVHLGDRHVDLGPGDAATFLPHEPHNYEPLDPPTSPDFPPLLLYVNRIAPPVPTRPTPEAA